MHRPRCNAREAVEAAAAPPTSVGHRDARSRTLGKEPLPDGPEFARAPRRGQQGDRAGGRTWRPGRHPGGAGPSPVSPSQGSWPAKGSPSRGSGQGPGTLRPAALSPEARGETSAGGRRGALHVLRGPGAGPLSAGWEPAVGARLAAQLSGPTSWGEGLGWGWGAARPRLTCSWQGAERQAERPAGQPELGAPPHPEGGRGGRARERGALQRSPGRRRRQSRFSASGRPAPRRRVRRRASAEAARLRVISRRVKRPRPAFSGGD